MIHHRDWLTRSIQVKLSLMLLEMIGMISTNLIQYATPTSTLLGAANSTTQQSRTQEEPMLPMLISLMNKLEISLKFLKRKANLTIRSFCSPPITVICNLTIISGEKLFPLKVLPTFLWSFHGPRNLRTILESRWSRIRLTSHLLNWGMFSQHSSMLQEETLPQLNTSLMVYP